MASNFAAIKAKARRDVHASFSVSATYQDYSLDTPVPLSVRWHNKIARFGDLLDGGYAEVVEGIERIIFMRDEVEAAGLILRESGFVTITAEGYENAVLVLAAQEPKVGPVEVIWMVSRS